MRKQRQNQSPPASATGLDSAGTLTDKSQFFATTTGDEANDLAEQIGGSTRVLLELLRRST